MSNGDIEVRYAACTLLYARSVSRITPEGARGPFRYAHDMRKWGGTQIFEPHPTIDRGAYPSRRVSLVTCVHDVAR